jgi:hypothetical protein
MTKRVWHIAILAAVLAAGSEIWLLAAPSVDPPRIADTWTLSGTADCVKYIPLDIRQWRGISNARRVCRADYTGSSPMRLTLVEMPGSPGAAAFDAWQKWRPAQPGMLGFYKGRFFGVAESRMTDRKTLNLFTSAVEKSLPGRSEGRW